jgi:DNA polymerase elongation subunit (family B)
MHKSDIITGYNSESFDSLYFQRAERLNMDVTDVAITLNRISKIKRKPATVKFGDTERYEQTHMFGYY